MEIPDSAVDSRDEKAGERSEPAPDNPNDSARLPDQLKGQTTEHATPARLEDEGQSGG